MSTPDGRDRGPDEDWFGEEEEWQERPTAEQAAPGRARLQLPPPGSPGRRRLALAALVGALLLILLIVGLVEAGGDGEAEPTITPPPPPAETAPTTQTETGATDGGQPALVPTDEALVPGATGPPVRRLQRALNTLGYDVGRPDGQYGAQTQEAVSAFQEAEGLDVDGVAGPETLEAVNRALQERGR
jgi:Putative peptidoglycan binding domain